MDMPETGDTSNNINLNNKTTGTPGKLDISMDFIMQLASVYNQYIIMKNAFVQSDEEKVKQTSQDVLKALGKMDMKLLTG
jgi:spore coat polysaccharide biosynthesis predicted glycosyltransferase SpsG